MVSNVHFNNSEYEFIITSEIFDITFQSKQILSHFDVISIQISHIWGTTCGTRARQIGTHENGVLGNIQGKPRGLDPRQYSP